MNITNLEMRRKLHIMQLASWLASQNEYVDVRTLPMRAHCQGRKNLKMYRINKHLYQKSFVYQAGHWWNELPRELHCIKDQEKLKAELKKYIT